MVRRTVDIPEETDATFRKEAERSGETVDAYIARRLKEIAEEERDAEARDAAARQSLGETIRAIQARNADLTPEEAQRLADEAVAEVRAQRS